ncbi:unnamed protein product, partial [Staurois parvus]
MLPKLMCAVNCLQHCFCFFFFFCWRVPFCYSKSSHL